MVSTGVYEHQRVLFDVRAAIKWMTRDSGGVGIRNIPSYPKQLPRSLLTAGPTCTSSLAPSIARRNNR